MANLQPFKFDEEKINPLEIALADNESFLVEFFLSNIDLRIPKENKIKFTTTWYFKITTIGCRTVGCF